MSIHCYMFHFASNTTLNSPSDKLYSFSTRRFLCHKRYLSSLNNSFRINTNAFTFSFHITVWLVPTRAISLFLVSDTLRRRLNVSPHSSDTRTRVNISFEHYVSTRRYQAFSHTRITPFSPFEKSQWAIQSTDSPLSVLISSLRLGAVVLLLLCFCFFCFFSPPTSILSSLTGPSKGLQGLIWSFFIPHCGLRANCRVWSVRQLVEISHSSSRLRLVSPCLNLGREGWSVAFSLCNPFDWDQDRSVGFRCGIRAGSTSTVGKKVEKQVEKGKVRWRKKQQRSTLTYDQFIPE